MYSKKGKNTALYGITPLYFIYKYGFRSTLFQSKTLETYQNCTFLSTLNHYKLTIVLQKIYKQKKNNRKMTWPKTRVLHSKQKMMSGCVC